MIISVIYLIFSFILDNFMSNIFPSTLSNVSYFTTIYIVISFVILYSYFSNEKKYYLLLIIFGILFDVLYTGTFILNVVIFLCIGFIIKLLNTIFSDNVFTTNMISVFSICLYHILSFIILSLVGGIDYDIMLLINIIIHSLISTVTYTSLSYYCMKYIYGKFNVKYIK